MAKAKANTINGQHGSVIELARFSEMEDYLTTAKDILDMHDEQLEDINSSLKELHAKIDRALSRLGIS